MGGQRMAHDLGGCSPFSCLGVVFLSVAVLHHLLQDHLVLVVALIVRPGLARHRLPDPAVLHDRFAVLLEREESLRQFCEAVIHICTRKDLGKRTWAHLVVQVRGMPYSFQAGSSGLHVATSPSSLSKNSCSAASLENCVVGDLSNTGMTIIAGTLGRMQLQPT